MCVLQYYYKKMDFYANAACMRNRQKKKKKTTYYNQTKNICFLLEKQPFSHARNALAKELCIFQFFASFLIIRKT